MCKLIVLLWLESRWNRKTRCFGHWLFYLELDYSSTVCAKHAGFLLKFNHQRLLRLLRELKTFFTIYELFSGLKSSQKYPCILKLFVRKFSTDFKAGYFGKSLGF